MAGYSLRRGVARDTRTLRSTLFDASHAQRQAELAVRVERLEAKLHAIEASPGIDEEALRAATMHTRLVCTPHGYQLVEVDAPPPAAGVAVEHDGSTYTVWRVGPSPLPGDRRRCAILV